MKRFILISLLVISSLGLWAQEINKSILGFQLGGIYTTFDIKNIFTRQGLHGNLLHIDKESSWTGLYFYPFDDEYVAFAGKKWTPLIILTLDNKLAKIQLSSAGHIGDKGFKELLSMYTQKYGEPKESNGDYFRWGDDFCISLKKNGRNGTVTLIYYSETLCEQIKTDVYNEI